jgi:hypothetical protein
MPGVVSLLPSFSNDDGEAACEAEAIPLWLPSSLPLSLPHQLHTTGMLPVLLEKEKHLLIAQADDALADICQQRRTMTGLMIFKKLNISDAGQKQNTRMHTLFKRFNNKTERVADRYRDARRALEILDPDGDWKIRLQVLHAEDIRGPGKGDLDASVHLGESSDKHHELSWIWLVPRVETAPDMENTEHLDASLRVEWAKLRAQAT